MIQPVKNGRELIEEIDQTITATPTLWWLGHAGFILRFATITFYIDPCLSTPAGRERLIAAPLDPAEIRHADLILSTHADAGHLDGPSVAAMLESSKRAKLVLPKSAADHANALGIPYARMTTTDADLRIEYFKDDLYGRVYAIPSAHPGLDWSAGGGYPHLGYLIRFGRWTVYHAGDCAMYDSLAARLRPFNVSVALLPIGGRNFSVCEAAELAQDIGAEWMVPMHCGTFSSPAHYGTYSAPSPTSEIACGETAADDRDQAAFIAHMLGQRPGQRFKVFECAEKWTVPED